MTEKREREREQDGHAEHRQGGTRKRAEETQAGDAAESSSTACFEILQPSSDFVVEAA